MKKKVAVVIPSYTLNLKKNELISLCQCRRILGSYDRYLLLPEGLNVDYCEDEYIIRVDPICLSSRKMYSDYVLSESFYDLFSDYEYILLYQLDAFVFNDRLNYFCNLDYDYIGAEWLYGLECHVKNKKLWFFGNGGFSLRKVSSFKKWIIDNKEEVYNGRMILPEDLVISIYGNDNLKIAERKISMDFSFDMHPKECFEINNKKLPFGCHAWHRFDNFFWKKIIDSYGYDVELQDNSDEETLLLCSGRKRAELLNKYFDKNKIENCLHKLLSEYKDEIYIFGAGQYGFSFINMIKETKIKVIGILDNDENKIGKSIENIKILNAKDIIKDTKIPILITLAKPDEIIKMLEEIGMEKGINYAISRDLQMRMCEE